MKNSKKNRNFYAGLSFKENMVYTFDNLPFLDLNAPKENKIKTGYKHLEEMIEVKNDYPSYTPLTNPFTNRIFFILNALNKMGVQYQTDIFDRDIPSAFNYDDTKLVNVSIEFGSHLKDEPAIVFEAHHDIANKNSQNCQDNSASVCNLLHLCEILSLRETHDKRVIVLFSDKEESGGTGAARFGYRSTKGFYGPIKYVLSLELTGLGDGVWLSSARCRGESFLRDEFKSKIDELHEVSCPFNTSMIFSKEFDSHCVGILPKKQLESGIHSTWSLCHSMSDTIDKCSAEDMENFVNNVLLKLIDKKEEEILQTKLELE